MTATILVADDDPDILGLVRLRLERDGYDVLTASCGEEALALARGRRPALAVLDVSMPGMTGLEVTRELRAHQATAAIPVILLTARVQEPDIAAGLASGANAYLKKPFRPQDLREQVAALLA